MGREVVAELEGTLLRSPDVFPYFMLVAFEASGLIRFALLLLLWPVVRLLGAAGRGDLALRVMVFVAVAGVREAEIEAVARAVLPKFFLDDVDMTAWGVFSTSSEERRVVVTALPRVMVEMFAKDHLRADEVVGASCMSTAWDRHRVPQERNRLSLPSLSKKGERPRLGIAPTEQLHPPFLAQEKTLPEPRPLPVIFHDGRLVPRPTPAMALLIILWIPIGVLVAFVRILVGIVVPLRLTPYLVRPFGGELIVRGRPPQPPTSGTGGVLFVCTHRTLMDPVVLSMVLGRNVPAVTYSISRLSEILSPIRTVRLSRDRQVDGDRIKAELAMGDLVVCPEGTTCREPFLLRFSGLFAELTDRIVPVAMNYRVGFFHATTARGWKAMDPIFFFMNPRPAYEVTFLNQLPAEATCSAGKNPHDVANYCTNFTRKDKYRVLAGNDGMVSSLVASATIEDRFRRLLGFFFLH
ncbi:unnamed protein product [Spirodela intermedia]|uniref:Phospholipid/glycerol acyltransferase domain-containing protein n=1 Tax=Spirodela intermedia TaxID=51605 RepID=A0A7I8IH22_SPIIN|nr:unnamed protein product [Spirodela intermedia]CAA6656797.1 unnamed protein product [Spirodela intermedia]